MTKILLFFDLCKNFCIFLRFCEFMLKKHHLTQKIARRLLGIYARKIRKPEKITQKQLFEDVHRKVYPQNERLLPSFYF